MINWASFILRVCLGVMFMAHGLQMAFGFYSGPGIDAFAKMLTGLGFKPALFWSYLAAYTVLVGGLCLIIGLLTRVSSVLLLIFILVAAVKVHISKGFFLSAGGFEYTFIIASICVALILLGPGKFSINQKF